jgi:hypothetical protein
MNANVVDDIAQSNPDILDPEFLITCTKLTHDAIHYGVDGYTPRQVVTRMPGDTLLWKRRNTHG